MVSIGKNSKIGNFVELKKTYQFERTNATDPTTNWDLTLKDNSYSWGLGSEIYLMPKTLSLLLQYDNVNSNGDADFGLYYAGADPNPDMANWDDYRLNSYSIKLRYSTVSQYTFTLGYAYQSYKYNSGQWDNYSLVNSSNTLLSGAYANPNYDAQILFVAVDYKF